MKLRRTDIRPLKRRQRGAASLIETKVRNWLGHIQATEQASLNRTSLPPLSAKMLSITRTAGGGKHNRNASLTLK